MASIDVTIRGAGIFGLSIAWACARRGARVCVVDPNGVAAGASGGIVGALAPHVPENWNEKKAFQFESLVLAERFWSDVAEFGGQDPGYARTGRVQPLTDSPAVDLARQRAQSARTLWQGDFSWELTDSPGALACPSATGLYVRDTLTARLHPRKATLALARALETLGVAILPDAPWRGAEVWATGVADLAAMSAASSRLQGAGVKGQAVLLRHAAPEAPQLFADSLHFVPHVDGTLAIGSTSERDFATPDQTDVLLDDLLARARGLCPAIAQAEVLERWAGLRPRSRSRAPVLGPHPLRPGAFIANGGFKIGFGMAPKVGEVMADLVLEERDRIPASFRPEPL